MKLAILTFNVRNRHVQHDTLSYQVDGLDTRSELFWAPVRPAPEC